MAHSDISTRISRRQALVLGSGVAAGGLLSATSPMVAGAAPRPPLAQSGTLPVKQIETIVQAQGTVTKGVLVIDIERKDMGQVAGPIGVTFTPAFELDGTLAFQPLGNRLAFLNGDLPLRPSETQPFIDALVANGIVFQAFHQHYIEMRPNVWFIHFRGLGDPLKLARGIHNAIKVTSTPLPQAPPAHPKSPLDAKLLGEILRGQPSIGDEGVVTVNVARRDQIVIDGVKVSPEANISTGVLFKPLATTGSQAAVGPDFGMIGPEVQTVVSVMRRQGWFVGCLYNQETDETPQLYFAHMLKTGNAYTLAAEVRKGLDQTNSE
jgi:hypothetical protein